jgi:hypothetical protein
MGSYGLIRFLETLRWPAAALVAALLVSSVVLVALRIYTRELLVGRRNREQRRGDQRIQPLMNAYRVLAGGLRPATRPDEAGAIDGALSDVVLLGTRHQVELASRCARELLAGGEPPWDDLTADLRAELREHFDLPPVPADAALPRFHPAPQRPVSGGGGGGGGGRGGRGGGRGRR